MRLRFRRAVEQHVYGLCLRAACGLALAGAAAGCAATDVREMDVIERARRAAKLKREGRECFERFVASGSRDLEALECYREAFEMTTELLPSPAQCEECYVHFANGLRLTGIYYWQEEKEALRSLETAAPAEVPALEEKARRAREKVVEYFTRSNDILEVYFDASETIYADAYDWASQQFAELGDYRRALTYLRRFETVARRIDDRKRRELTERRRVYEREFKKQRVREVRRSLES